MTHAVIEARQTHIGPHVAHLTAEERSEIERVSGVAPRRFLRRMMAQSSYARAGLIDSVPVALWGVTGTLASSSGYAWLSVTPECRARRFLTASVARAEAAAILATKSELRSAVFCDDARAMRFLRFLGFEIGEPFEECGRMSRSAVLKRPWTQLPSARSVS